MPEAKVPKVQSGTLNDTLEIELIKLLKKNSKVTQDILARELNVSLRSLKRIMKKLTEKGVVERSGGKRYGYWKIHEENEE